MITCRFLVLSETTQTCLWVVEQIFLLMLQTQSCLMRSLCICLSLCLMSQKKDGSLVFKIPFFSPPPLCSSLGSPTVLLCNSAQAKKKCFYMASQAHFSFGTPTAHMSWYTNTDIFLSSVSGRCWRLLFCLMKTAPLFVLCLMFQDASHFQVL